jgi:hypothetical protein
MANELFTPQEWNLWIDDMRDPAFFLKDPLPFYEFQPYHSLGMYAQDFIWAKSAKDAIALVKAFGPPKFMALDHDLGDHTVFQFLNWLAEEHSDSPPEWECHSANPSGAANVNAFMLSWHKAKS